MSDTNTLRFSLRERGWISTKRFEVDDTAEPGQTIMISVDPVSALLQKGTAGAKTYASSLAFTLSRFRDFRYVGTKLSLVPVATTAQVDPAHVQQTDTVDPTLNFVHPRDVGNMIHWRRWVGGNIALPHVDPTGPNKVYTEADSYNLDAAWLSDVRFNHAPISDGFSIWTVPLRASAEMPAMMTNSVFAYENSLNVSPADSTSVGRQPRGTIAMTGGRVYPDSWGPNPFAGFVYTMDDTSLGQYDPAQPKFIITDVNRLFPWFGDFTLLPSSDTYDEILSYVRQRYLTPVCILRLPPAYGTRYFWTLYMRHYFEVRRPYLVNGTWKAGHATPYVPSVNGPAPGDLMLLQETPEIPTVQMIAPDPYGAGDSLALLRCECGPMSVDPYAVVGDDVAAKFERELDEFDANHGCGNPHQQEPEDVTDIHQNS